LQSEYDELSKKYKDAKSFSRNMIAVLIFVLAIAVVIILNIMLFGRKKKGKDELSEDNDPELDEPENEDDEANEETETEKKPFLGKFHGFQKMRMRTIISMTRKSTSRKNIQSTGLTANGMIMRMKFYPLLRNQ